jgi:hypothetical protein
MQIKKVFRIIATSALAAGVLVSSFIASAATIVMDPSSQLGAPNTSYSIDIMAIGLPDGTVGGALDISWTGDMALDSIYLATTDPADNGGGLFPGEWEPVSSFFSGVDSTGPGSISGLYVGNFAGVIGDQAIARLNFTTGAGFSGSTISMDAAAIGGTWSSWISGDFTNTYEGATINAVPVPAALWLFGSGLIGLVGVARRRRQI